MLRCRPTASRTASLPFPTVNRMPATSVRSGREAAGRSRRLRRPPKTGRAFGLPAPRAAAAPEASPRREPAPTWAGGAVRSRPSPRNVRTFRRQCLGTQRPRGPSAAATTTSPRGAEAGGGLRVPRGHRPRSPGLRDPARRAAAPRRPRQAETAPGSRQRGGGLAGPGFPNGRQRFGGCRSQ